MGDIACNEAAPGKPIEHLRVEYDYRAAAADAANAPICPRCQVAAVRRSTSYVYGRDYGRDLWVCPNYPRCDMFVGMHPDGKPLGTMAGASLRRARNAAHAVFDPLWKSGQMRRPEAYEWLAGALGLAVEDTHIALFDEAKCADVVAHAKMKRLELSGAGGADSE